MVAQFLRLKITLLGNTFRRNPWQLAGMLLALAYGLGLAGIITVGLVGLRFASPDIARAIVIVFGTVVVLGFLLLPLVFGVDDSLDPRRFALFGIPTERLALSLALAAFISVPTLVVTVFALAQIGTWSRDAVSTLLAIVAAVLIVPTCVLAARVSTAIAAFFLSARRVREAAGIILIAVLAFAAPFIALMATMDWESRGLPIVRRIAAVATWTPFGAVWSIPADAANGRPEAWAKLLIAVVFLAALWLAWRALVSMMLVTSQRETTQHRYSGLGWFERMPATPGGAIAARSLSYWGRDARYRVALLAVPVVPILIVVVLLVAGVPVDIVAWLPVPVACLFLGWSIHNDVAYDSTAFWEHVAANSPGASDRFGRTVPVLFVGAPVVLLGSAATSLIVGNWAMLPGLIGLSAGVLLIGLGISSVVSAAFPYPTVHPGDSPFAQPQAAGTTGSVIQTVSFFATAISTAPVIYFIWLGATEAPVWYWAALALGLGLGGLALLVGVRWGGAIVNRHAPELLAFTVQN